MMMKMKMMANLIQEINISKKYNEYNFISLKLFLFNKIKPYYSFLYALNLKIFFYL